MPEQTPKVLVHIGRKPRFQKIIQGFLSGITFDQFIDVGFRLDGPTPEPEALALAIHSGKRVPKPGVSRALRRFILTCQYRWSWQRLRRGEYDYLLVWNGVKGHRALLVEAARNLGITVVFFEEAPLPGRITADTRGVNYELSLPRDPAFFAAYAKRKSAAAPEAWRDLRADLKARATTFNKAVGQGEADRALGTENYIFCPLQVPGDSQITVFGDWIDSVPHLIETLHRVRQVLPEGWHIRLKEHPSSRVSLTNQIESLADDRLRLDNTTDTMEQVANARAVLTVNSSVGLEAFFFDKPVITLGQAFYGFGELAYKVHSEADLEALLSDPEALGFDVEQRSAFMGYLAAEQFPKEADLIEGRYRLADLLGRNTVLAA